MEQITVSKKHIGIKTINLYIDMVLQARENELLGDEYLAHPEKFDK